MIHEIAINVAREDRRIESTPVNALLPHLTQCVMCIATGMPGHDEPVLYHESLCHTSHGQGPSNGVTYRAGFGL